MMKIGTRVEFSREEVSDILVRFARQQLGEAAKGLEDPLVLFAGENKYLDEKPKEPRCRDCGCNILARTARKPFDQAVVLLSHKEESQ
ncbi:MAG: hypothetical protein GY772_20600 [bacterium]|jgi:hypothetical protein|nr:hypothetical protein [bacterium]